MERNFGGQFAHRLPGDQAILTPGVINAALSTAGAIANNYVSYHLNKGDTKGASELPADYRGLVAEVKLPGKTMLANYNLVKSYVQKISSGALGPHSRQLSLDAALPKSSAPLVTLKTFKTDWNSKRQRPDSLENYFNRPQREWQLFNWDGMFLWDLEARPYGGDPISPERLHELATFSTARDASGRIYLPELLAVEYVEGSSTGVDTHCYLGPVWENKSDLDFGYDMFNQAVVDGRPVDLQFQEKAGLFGHGVIDVTGLQRAYVDLRDNHGRGVIFPLRNLCVYTDFTAVAVQARLLYRYAPVDFIAIRAIYETYRRLDESFDVTSRTSNAVRMRGRYQIRAYIAWYEKR